MENLGAKRPRLPLRRRFVSITEYGVPAGRKEEVSNRIREQRLRVERQSVRHLFPEQESSGPTLDCGFDLFSLGVSDIVSVHAVTDIRFLAAFNDFVPVHHQRSSGAFVPEETVEETERFIVAARDQTEEARRSPIHGVIHLKLDTVVSVLAGDLVVPRLVQTLRVRLHDRAVVLRGLDTVEVVLLIRATDIDTLAQDVAGIFALDVASLELGPAYEAKIAERLEAAGFNSDRHTLRAAPLLLHSHTMLGMCRVRAHEAAVQRESNLAAKKVRVLQYYRVNPIPTPATQDHLPEGERPHASYMFGSDHIVVTQPPQNLSVAGLAALVRGEDPIFPPPLTTPRFYRRRTLLAPEGAGAVEAAPGGSSNTSLRSQLQYRLEEARKALTDPDEARAPPSWLLTLREAARAHQWPYPTTNAALSLTFSLTCLISDPDELQNHLDLVPILEHWLRSSTVPAPPTSSRFRLFRHLDRVMNARSHRESPSRPPAVTRASEARAAQVFPRDIFNAYVSEVNAAIRGPAAPPPLIVDGSDAELRVKVGDRTGIFMICPLRLHQPFLWPMLGHEAAHVHFETARLESVKVDEARWQDCFTRLMLGDRPDPHELLGRVLHRVASQCIELADAEREPSHPSRVQAYAVGLLELAADLAVFDAGLLGFELDPYEELRRFSATFLPNLTMDTAFAARLVRERGAESSAVRQLAFRLLGLLVLAPLPSNGRALDPETVRTEILRCLNDGADPRHILLETALSAPQLVPNKAEPLPPEPLFDAELRTSVLEELRQLFEEEGASHRRDSARHLCSALGLIQALRQPPFATSRTGRDLVATYLSECMGEIETPGLIVPDVRPRGGLDYMTSLGQACLRRLPDFFSKAAGLVQAHQASALGQLLSLDTRERKGQ